MRRRRPARPSLSLGPLEGNWPPKRTISTGSLTVDVRFCGVRSPTYNQTMLGPGRRGGVDHDHDHVDGLPRSPESLEFGNTRRKSRASTMSPEGAGRRSSLRIDTSGDDFDSDDGYERKKQPPRYRSPHLWGGQTIGAWKPTRTEGSSYQGFTLCRARQCIPPMGVAGCAEMKMDCPFTKIHAYTCDRTGGVSWGGGNGKRQGEGSSDKDFTLESTKPPWCDDLDSSFLRTSNSYWRKMNGKQK